MNATTTLFATLKSLESKGYLVSRNNDAEEKLQVSSIQEYNEYLVYNKRLLPIVDYIEKVNELLWQHDISFMRTFLDYIDREDFCIDHAMIKDYGICDFAGGSGHLLTKLKSAKLEEGEDYALTNLRECRPQGGFVNKKVYTLTPNAFILLCIRSGKTKNYAKLFIFIQKLVIFYNHYQLALNDAYILSFVDRHFCQRKPLDCENKEELRLKQFIDLDRKVCEKMNQVGCVYAIQSGDEFFKIGYTYELRTRIQELQVGNPYELLIVYTFMTFTPEYHEKIIHSTLDSYRCNGEWFKISKSKLLSILKVHREKFD